MARPTGGYVNAEKRRIPGTTTFTSIAGDSGGLMFWAYEQGKEHQRLLDTGQPAPSGLYDARDKAADTGTVAHELVEQYIHKNLSTKDLLIPNVAEQYNIAEDDAERAVGAFKAYRSWERQTKVKIVATEMPLVSEKYQFGGTPDAIGLLDGKHCLLDWKTSNGVYESMLAQLAAYRILIHECTDWRLDGGFHLLRFSKEHGDFAHHFYPDLVEAEEAALLCRRLYDLRKLLKKRV